MPRSLSQQPGTHGLLTANLVAQLVLGLAVMTITLPSMQEWAAIFGSTQAAVQLTFSGYVVAYGLLQLVYGPLSDRVGRKKVLLFGLAVTVLGSLMAVFASDLPTLIAARVVQGMGCAAGMVIGRALVQDLFDIRERTRIMAYVGMSLGLVPPLATVVGGQLHVHLGWRANFVVVTVLAAGLFVAAWRGLPDHQKISGIQPHWFRAMMSAYARLAREPVFILYVIVLSMTTSTFYAFLAGAPIVLGGLGVGPDGVGFYIMVGPLSFVVGNFITSRLARRIPDRTMMWIGQGLATAGVALMAVLGLAGLNTPLAFALPMILLGIGHGFLVPPALAGTVGLLPALAGAAAAVAGLMQQMLGAVGGFAVGFLTHADAASMGALMLGLVLIGVIAQVQLHRTTR
ncbi:MAG: Bcr/CflA family efflux MFS transporter [Rhodocyclaceae bacterium]|nr:MAG: Bcr/CflA family efflux MFS transporter [Rhodocyclaceae bacterium]